MYGCACKILKCRRVYQYLAAVTATLGIVSSEMHYGWSSPSLPILLNGNYTFHVTSEVGFWLVVIPLIGAIFGAIIAGTLTDNLGRKRVILATAIPFIISWLLVATAESLVPLFAARFISGIMDGVSFTAVPIYLSEIAEPQLRGVIISACTLVSASGVLFANMLGLYLPIDTVAYIAIIIPVSFLLTFFWIPESPYYYLMKEQPDRAMKSLQKFRGLTEVKDELDRMAVAVKEEKESKGRFLDLFLVQSNRRSLVIAIGLRVIQQLSGIQATIFYCEIIFDESKELLSSSTANLIYLTIRLITSVVASSIVDVIGRRPLIIISGIGTAIALFTIGSCLYIKNSTELETTNSNLVFLMALFSYIFIYGIGLDIVPVVIASEIFPMNVESYALCSIDVINSIAVIIVSRIFHWTNERFGMYVPFYLYTICVVFGIAFVYFYMPETKGRTLEDIQLEMRGNT